LVAQVGERPTAGLFVLAVVVMPTEGGSKAWSSRRVGLGICIDRSLAVGNANQFGWFVPAIILSSQRGGQIEGSVVLGGFAALALMTAVATTIVAAKTIEGTAEAGSGPKLRAQPTVGSPIVPPSSAACCSPRRTWDGCDRRHQPTPSRSPAASTPTCSLLHLQAVNPCQRSASLAERGAKADRSEWLLAFTPDYSPLLSSTSVRPQPGSHSPRCSRGSQSNQHQRPVPDQHTLSPRLTPGITMPRTPIRLIRTHENRRNLAHERSTSSGIRPLS
jgi:hypothetical protein